MDIGMLQTIISVQTVDHLIRLLRGSSAIEINQWVAIHFTAEYRKILADLFYVKRSGWLLIVHFG